MLGPPLSQTAGPGKICPTIKIHGRARHHESHARGFARVGVHLTIETGSWAPMQSSQFEDIRLVALDLDGTTLTTGKIMTPLTRDAIRSLVQSGMSVTFATGRLLPATTGFAREAGMTCPLVCMNGGLVTAEHKERTRQTRVSEALDDRGRLHASSWKRSAPTRRAFQQHPCADSFR